LGARCSVELLDIVDPAHEAIRVSRIFDNCIWVTG